MKKAIELLDKHFVNFSQELQKEANQQAKKIDKIFTEKNGESLQKEIIELLNELKNLTEQQKKNARTNCWERS
ncbi:MAG: hypothetical protein MRERC_1c182 [Mycoplasmataceae bacterium RC_NB112A]|nr:MAG: hypothetical protein MRERC_1c182 [Mycoplasmataceae bacterium RC_NB112A]